MIATIAGTTGKKGSAIVEIIWKPHFSDCSDHSILQRSLKSVFHMLATIAECFFPAVAAIVAII